MEDGSNVCRLCLAEKELKCVFENNSLKIDLQNVVLTATGVEIFKNDVISTKICDICSHVVINMHNFRERSNQTDKYLKELYLKARDKTRCNTNTTQKEPGGENVNEPYSSNTSANIECDNPNQSELYISNKDNSDQHSKNLSLPKRVLEHQSVSKLRMLYPELKLDPDVFACDFSPFVRLELNEIEKYCEDHNINMKLASEITTNVSISRSNTSAPDEPPNSNCLDKYNLEEQHHVGKKRIGHRTQDDMVHVHPSKRKRKSTRQTKVKKQMLSSREYACDIDVPHPTFFETLGLTSKQTKSEHNRKDETEKVLKLRGKNHLCCSFCNINAINNKLCHEQECVIGQALDSNPYVKLTKVDLDLHMRDKYLLNNDLLNTNDVVLPREELPVQNSSITSPKADIGKRDRIVEDLLTSSNMCDCDVSHFDFSEHTCVKGLASKKNPYVEVIRIDLDLNIRNKYLRHFDSLNATNNLKVPSSKSLQNFPDYIPNKTEVSSTTDSPKEKLPIRASKTSIVKPDIHINDQKIDDLLNSSNMCGSDAFDMVFFKELLQQAEHTKDKRLMKPTDREIKGNKIIKNMFLQLSSYKLPINYQLGERSVTITEPKAKVDKEVALWHRMKEEPLINRNYSVNLNKISLKPNKTDTVQRSVLAPVIMNVNSNSQVVPSPLPRSSVNLRNDIYRGLFMVSPDCSWNGGTVTANNNTQSTSPLDNQPGIFNSAFVDDNTSRINDFYQNNFNIVTPERNINASIVQGSTSGVPARGNGFYQNNFNIVTPERNINASIVHNSTSGVPARGNYFYQNNFNTPERNINASIVQSGVPARGNGFYQNNFNTVTPERNINESIVQCSSSGVSARNNGFYQNNFNTVTPERNIVQCSTSDVPARSNDFYQNNFNTIRPAGNIIPSVVQCSTSAVPDNLTFSRPKIWVKSLHKLLQ